MHILQCKRLPRFPPQVFSSLTATRRLLEQRGLRPLLLVHPRALPDFAGLPTADPNCVVVGLAQEAFSYQNMNRAFRLLLQPGGGCRQQGKREGGVPCSERVSPSSRGHAPICLPACRPSHHLCAGTQLIAVHKGQVFKEADRLSLGPGPFVLALEHASGKAATVRCAALPSAKPASGKLSSPALNRRRWELCVTRSAMILPTCPPARWWESRSRPSFVKRWLTWAAAPKKP